MVGSDIESVGTRWTGLEIANSVFLGLAMGVSLMFILSPIFLICTFLPYLGIFIANLVQYCSVSYRASALAEGIVSTLSVTVQVVFYIIAGVSLSYPWLVYFVAPLVVSIVSMGLSWGVFHKRIHGAIE